MTPYNKKEIKARQRAFTSGNVIKHKELCEKVSELIKRAKKEHYHSKAKGRRNHNPTRWYKDIFQLAGFEANNNTIDLSHEQATSTTEQLQNSFTRPWNCFHTSPIPSLADVAPLLREELPCVPSVGQVKATLRHLNSRKATGSDKIPAWFLKRFCEELATVVHDIISSSILQHKYPSSYKHALVTPIPKVLPPTDIENDFLQISILPQMAKVLEKLQLNLNSTDLKIHNSQHAFTNDRSTVSALASIS